MDGFLPILLTISLLASGIAAGVLLWSVMGGVPLLLSLPAERYVEIHQFWGSRFDGLQPLLVTTTAILGAILAIVAPDPFVSALLGLASAASLAVILISRFRNVPLKRRVMRLDPKNLPADWEQLDPRQEWARWNLARTVCGIAAFTANVVAVPLLL